MMSKEAIIMYGYTAMLYPCEIIPVRLFSNVCPMRVMTSATLKAVPEREA